MAELGIEVIFFVLGGIIFTGYFGELVSKKYNIPSALFLLILGFLIKYTGYIDPAPLIGIQPIFGSLALILIMFDGSLSLNIYNVIFKSARSFAMAVLITVLCILASILLFHYILGFNIIIGAIIGSLAGGIGSTTTISMLSGLNIPKNIKEFLTLESSITDVFSIILTLILTTALISGVFDLKNIGQGVLSTFSIGAFLGLIISLVFITLLHKIKSEYGYMVTFGVILFVYSVSTIFGGSGAISVLVFGLMLGNEKEVRRIFRIRGDGTKSQIRKFQAEISFFVRTFFFVYLGFIVNLGSIQNLLIAIAAMLAFYLMRYLSAVVITRKSDLFHYRYLLSAVNPRGLATAVLATYPLEQIRSHIVLNGSNSYLNLISIQANALPEIAFYLIVLSVLLTTFTVPMAMNKLEENSKEDSKNQKNGKREESGESE